MQGYPQQGQQGYPPQQQQLTQQQQQQQQAQQQAQQQQAEKKRRFREVKEDMQVCGVYEISCTSCWSHISRWAGDAMLCEAYAGWQAVL
jgi:hypothetical protein